MNKFIAVAAMFLLVPPAVVADGDPNMAEAKKITAAFFEELKGELGKAMKAGGPVAAIGACSGLAPAIAAKHSNQTGWDVGRTSLKLRNPNNAPDAWETRVLEQFAERRAQGEAPGALVIAETVEVGGDQYFRFMKGIVMPPADKMPCLKCHGEDIDPEIAAMLDELYPQDKARGYRAGQVRGAFTLKKKL